MPSTNTPFAIIILKWFDDKYLELFTTHVHTKFAAINDNVIHRFLSRTWNSWENVLGMDNKVPGLDKVWIIY
jgi:hypothetical protein